MFAAFAAVALLSAAVWLAGAPAARAAAQWAAFAAAYPGYGAYYQGGYQYPAAPNGYAAPAQPGNGVQGQAAAPIPTSAPVADAAAPTFAPTYPPPPSTWQPTRAGSVDGLSVSAADPVDPGTSSDIWRP